MVEPSSKGTGLRRILPIGIFFLLVCIFLFPVLFGGRVLLPATMLGKMSPWNAGAVKADGTFWNALTWDCDAHFYPSRLLIQRALHDRELPLWNPYQMCGMPCLADGQAGALYPPNLLFFALFPAALAMGLLAALHLLAAGGFTYIFLRGSKLSRTASTFGGIVFMLCGYSVVWLHLPVFLASGVWLPLSLHLTRCAHERKSAFYAAWAGATIALPLLGHPQIAFYSMVAVFLYWAHLTFHHRNEVPIRRSIVLICITFGIGLALAAPQVLPMQELAGLSHRGAHAATAEGYAGYSSLAMPVKNLIGAVIPDFFGNPSKNTFWGADEYAEYCLYIGIIPLLLLPLAFPVKGKRREQIWFFGGLGILALLMALGTFVNRLLYFGIPGFTRSGSPARVLFLFMFSAMVLSSYGLEELLSNMRAGSTRVGRTILFSAGTAVLMAAILAVGTGVGLSDKIALPDFLIQVLPEAKTSIVFLAAGLGILLLMLNGKIGRQLGIILLFCTLIGDLLSFGMGYNPTSAKVDVYPKTELTEFLSHKTGFERIMPMNDRWSTRDFPSAVLPPNTGSVYGFYDVSGYDSLYPLRYKTLLDAAAGGESCPPENGNIVFARNESSPVYDLLGVRWFISRTPISGRNGRMIDACYVYRNEKALPRAFVAPSIEYSEDGDMLQRMRTGGVDLRRTALVSLADREKVNPWKESESLTIPFTEKSAVTAYTCNTVKVKVDTSGAGVLVLTDQYFPGWKARVDGAYVPITCVDYDFRGIPVSAGKHEVVFSYEPESFRRGLTIGWIGFIVLACMSIAGAAGRLREKDRQV